MVNLIAGRRIVPELLQDRFTAANVAAALRPLLDDTPERAQMIADLAEAPPSSLQPPPEPAPSSRSATPSKPFFAGPKPAATSGPNLDSPSV